MIALLRALRISAAPPFAAILLAACGGHGELSVTGGRVTVPPGGMSMSAGYFTIDNGTGQAMTLQSVSSPQFGSVGMHETRTENGMSGMHELSALEVPAHSKVAFAPGGKHLMMMEPKSPVTDGARIPVTLSFTAADGTASKIEATFAAGDASAAHEH